MGWFDRKKAPAPAKEQTIAEEAGLPDNWVPVQAPVVRPGIETNGPHQYPSGTLPQLLGLQPDLVDTKYGGGIPSVRLMPIASTAATNAAVAATIKTIIQTTPPAASTGAGSSGITFTAPPEFIVSGSPGSTIGLAWTPETPGSVLQGPIKGLIGFDRSFIFGDSAVSGAATAPFSTTVPASTPAWALFTSASTATFGSTTPTGWTDILGLSSTSRQFAFKVLPSTGGFTGSQSYTGPGVWATAICYFGGPVPTFVQEGHVTGSTVSGVASVPMAGLTAGNALLVIVNVTPSRIPPAFSVYFPSIPVVVTDSQTNTVFQLAKAATQGSNSTGDGAQTSVNIIENISAGSDTVSVTIPRNTVGSYQVTVIEITPPSAVAGVPRFQPPPPTDLFNVTGILQTLNGGTGGNNNATGGASKVVMQENVGAPFNIRQLSASDLTDGTTGSGNVVLASVIAQKVAAFGSNGLVNNVALTTLFNTFLTGAGLYRLSYYMILNTAATTSSTLPNLTLTWLDPDSATVQTARFQAPTPSANTLTTMFSGDLILDATAGSNIQYQTGDVTAYASAGATAMKYTLRLRLEAL